MEKTQPEPSRVVVGEPLFRDTLRGPEEERVDYLTFTNMQPESSDVMKWLLSYLGQILETSSLKLQLIYVKSDQDYIADGDLDNINALIDDISGSYARLNWVIDPRDTGCSAIFMRESGREPCELQLITATKGSTVNPAGILDFITSQYESSLPTKS